MAFDDINKIIDGLQGLQGQLITLEGRINELEDKKQEDDKFFKDLEILLQIRNKS